jgi:hypothetical protein
MKLEEKSQKKPESIELTSQIYDLGYETWTT